MITPTHPLQISGREMFEFNPEMVEEDDLEATDEVVYRRSESEGEEEVSDKRYLPFCVWLFCMIIIYWLIGLPSYPCVAPAFMPAASEQKISMSSN